MLALFCFSLMIFSGCSGNIFTGSTADAPPTVDTVEKGEENRIRAGDEINVRITGTSTTLDNIYAESIGEAGEISLPYVDQVKAAGKTPQELAADIKKAYIDGGFFRVINVTCSLKDRFFYIRGEVRSSGRYLWSPDMTILKAITTAGGFTDFANPRDVRIDRRGQLIKVNCSLAYSDPKYDIPILPSDSVTIPRSIF
jgi:protein involved in polysaccharide export with SLBB domain